MLTHGATFVKALRAPVSVEYVERFILQSHLEAFELQVSTCTRIVLRIRGYATLEFQMEFVFAEKFSAES